MLELGHSGKGHGDESLETAEASIGDLRLRKLPIIGLKVGRRPGYRAFGYATQQLTQRPMVVLGNSLANHVSGVGHFIATYRVDPSVSQRCDVKAAASDLDIEQKWKNAVSVSRAHVYAGMSGVQRIPPLGAQILSKGLELSVISPRSHYGDVFMSALDVDFVYADVAHRRHAVLARAISTSCRTRRYHRPRSNPQKYADLLGEQK